MTDEGGEEGQIKKERRVNREEGTETNKEGR